MSYALFRGFPACECLIEWLPWYEKVLLHLGEIKHNIDIYQLHGFYSGSGGTHGDGGVFDIAQTSPISVHAARNMGADATWHRPYNWDGRKGIEHTHGVLRGCPHNSPARYQIAAVDEGYNGLGRLGHGGPDTGPRPLSGRTWQEGIEWAKKILGAPAPTPVSGPLKLTVANWNVASPKWFKPWDTRKYSIGKVLKDISPDVLVCEETHFSYMTADILAALGPQYSHVSSPVGTDVFYRHDKSAQTRPYVEYSMKIQGRAAGLLHLQDRATGIDFTILNTHAPALVPGYRVIFGRNVTKLALQADNARIIVGDWNTKMFSRSPRKDLRGAGFRCEREQTVLTNGSPEEFPGKGWLAGIYTRPSEARITGGRLIETSPRLSDHRPFVVNVEVK